MLGLPQKQEPQLRSAVRIGPGGLVPVVFLAGFFAVFAPYADLSIGVAALLGAIGGTVSLIVHELGHVRAASEVEGIRSADVSLIWAGAATRFEGKYASGREQVRVAIAGPRASFAFAGALLLPCLFPTSPFRDIFLALVGFNILLGIVNLVPTSPLDGYKVIVGLLWSATGSEGKARRIIRRIGVGWAALELSSAVVLLFAKPEVGIIAVFLAAVFMGQKHFTRKHFTRKPVA